jgi:hypothetical protein
MPCLVISDHVWLNKTGAGVFTQAVLKRYLVPALNGSADEGNAHIRPLSGEERKYTLRLSTEGRAMIAAAKTRWVKAKKAAKK